MTTNTIKQILLVAAINHVQSVEINKHTLPNMQDFKCVSHTAFRKFDYYIAKVMNRNVTNDVIYCEYDFAYMPSNPDEYEWSDED